jgi:biotin-(acetyl-CoA carboxylase) ligase
VAAVYVDRMRALAGLLRAGDWDSIAAAWEGLAPGACGRRIRVRRADTIVAGSTQGIDDRGALRVRCDDGGMISVHLSDSIVREEG